MHLLLIFLDLVTGFKLWRPGLNLLLPYYEEILKFRKLDVVAHTFALNVKEAWTVKIAIVVQNIRKDY